MEQSGILLGLKANKATAIKFNIHICFIAFCHRIARWALNRIANQGASVKGFEFSEKNR